jgi:hypothetical protein
MCNINRHLTLARIRKTNVFSVLACVPLAILMLGQTGCGSSTLMNKSSTPIVEVSAADAAAAGLPAVEVSISKTKIPLTPRRLPSADTYVSASGPPGGPLGLTVTAGAANAPETVKSLREGGHEDVQTAQVTWNGQSAPAIASRQGQSNARRQELRVLALTAGGKGVWITIAAPVAAEAVTPTQLAARSPFSELLAAVHARVP